TEVSVITYKIDDKLYFTSTIHDITERKKMEEQIRQSQKMEAIGILAGGVAHDLNNILSAMVGYPDLLLLNMPDDSPIKQPLLSIKSAGEKAANIVNDMLTLARRGVRVSEAVSLNTVITEYLGSQQHEKLRYFHPGVEFEISLASDSLNTISSPVHLSKVVMNLVSNAAEAMPEGGKIIVATENRYLDKPVKGYEKVNEGDYVVLTVQDNGVGISKEDMLRIFEPFYTKKVMGRSGTGLGLAVVWGTVKDNDGYIVVDSTPGKGTAFILYFPATRQETEAKKKEMPIGHYSGNGEHILIVDDLETQRDLASNMLKRLNYHVETAASGEEAIEYLKSASVDLVILDMIMDPGIDGFETYRRILEIQPNQKAIIASGFSETGRVKKAQRLGAGAYIKKPYTLENLGMAVKAELAK
ncbi:MAG: response regulator, partial [Proteobacteria bacterium]|nr:response regulator [Pseudomonadota bacterium]